MIRFFARHPTAANLLMLGFFVVGIFSLPDIKRETFPDFRPKEVEVSVLYPGATAEDVEEAICRRLESALESVTYIEEYRSEARENRGTVTVEMEDGADFEQFFNDIRTEVEAIDDFPDEAEDAVIRTLNKTDRVITLAVTGPMDVTDLKVYCEQLEDRILQQTLVSQVELTGFSDRQIRIEIPAHALMQYGLSVDSIAGVIQRQSIDLPAGMIEDHEREVVIRFDDERRKPEEFRDLVVVAEAGQGVIRLGDIATITDRFEKDEERVYLNGQRAGLLRINKTKQQDALNVLESLQAFLEVEQARMPAGIEFELTEDITSIVSDRLNMLTKNGIQGLILVFLVMWLFFGFRYSFWVAAGLPASFMGAFFVMQLFGLSLNMLTMVGLLIAIGLLMDDSIVISENIATHFQRTGNALEAAVQGVREVAMGVISSFTTTICVFGPLAFLEGTIGKVLEAMPAVLIITLCVSLIEAFMILPHHLAHSLEHRHQAAAGGVRKRLDALIEHIRENYLGRLVDFVLAWRYAAMGLVIFTFLVSVGLVVGGLIKFTAFPELDGDVVAARVLLPQGTPLERTEEIVNQLTHALEAVDAAFAPRQPDGQALVEKVTVQYNLNADAYETGPHVATVNADLLSAEVRDAGIDDILALWREKTGEPSDVISLKFVEPVITPAGRPFDIRIMGENLAQLKAAAIELTNELNSYRGPVDVSDDLRPGRPEARIRPREGAYGLGLDASSIASQLRSAFFGKTASEIQVGDEDFEIDVRFDPRDRDSLADLDNFHLTLASGEQVPLSAVAEVESGRGWARIARIDGRRTVSIQADIDTRLGNTAQILADLKSEFIPDLQAKYQGLTVTYSGEAEEAATTQRSMMRGVLIGAIGIFILLSFQFRSYIEPLVVMVAIPLALIGVIWGHIIMGLDLTMPSMMGFISLSGIVVNDSILLVTFVQKRLKEGRSIAEAAAQASRDRFRAILLTSLTTVAGLLPLLAERSLQAQILIPLATSIVFGLLSATVLVLIVVPALYSILGDLGLTRHKTEQLTS